MHTFKRCFKSGTKSIQLSTVAFHSFYPVCISVCPTTAAKSEGNQYKWPLILNGTVCCQCCQLHFPYDALGLKNEDKKYFYSQDEKTFKQGNICKKVSVWDFWWFCDVSNDVALSQGGILNNSSMFNTLMFFPYSIQSTHIAISWNQLSHINSFEILKENWSLLFYNHSCTDFKASLQRFHLKCQII